MIVGVMRAELILHASFSLKDKRRCLKSVLARLRRHFPVSAAEVGLHDQWAGALIGIALVGAQRRDMDRVFQKIEEEILRQGTMDIACSDVEWLHYS